MSLELAKYPTLALAEDPESASPADTLLPVSGRLN